MQGMGGGVDVTPERVCVCVCLAPSIMVLGLRRGSSNPLRLRWQLASCSPALPCAPLRSLGPAPGPASA